MAKLSPCPTSYAEADAALGAKSYRRIGHNTSLNRSPVASDGIAVRLHGTNVVTFTPDGWAIIRTGGWDTPTTKDRINAVLPLPWRVYTRRYVMHLGMTGNAANEYRWTDLGALSDGDAVRETDAGYERGHTAPWNNLIESTGIVERPE